MSLTRAQRACDADRIAGIPWGRAGVLDSKYMVHLQFGALKRSRVPPAHEQRCLHAQRRRASPVQPEEGKARAPARARCAAARCWVLCLRMHRDSAAGTPARPAAALMLRRQRRLLHVGDAPPPTVPPPRAQHSRCLPSAVLTAREGETATSGADNHEK